MVSMEYCHKHDRHYDTDHEVECLECLREIDEACEVISISTLNSVELIHPETKVHWGPIWKLRGEFALCATWIGTEKARKEANEVEGWRVIYASSDIKRVMADALDMSHHTCYRYGILLKEVSK